jgi:hypothetical protein
VASVRKRDGAKRHDTFYSNAGHVRVSRERNAAVGGLCYPFDFSSWREFFLKDLAFFVYWFQSIEYLQIVSNLLLVFYQSDRPTDFLIASAAVDKIDTAEEKISIACVI